MDYLFVGGIFVFLGYIFIYIPIERYFSERKEKYLTAIRQIETLQKEINNHNKKKEELTNRINSLLELNTGLRENKFTQRTNKRELRGIRKNN